MANDWLWMSVCILYGIGTILIGASCLFTYTVNGGDMNNYSRVVTIFAIAIVWPLLWPVAWVVTVAGTLGYLVGDLIARVLIGEYWDLFEDDELY